MGWMALVALLVFANALLVLRMLLHVSDTHDVIPVREPNASLPTLSIIVPARNEARQIERCVRSLLAQRYPDFEVIVVDDESTDDTRTIVERVASDDPRLRVVVGAPLPDGWVGKPWALTQGERIARGEWMLCTDADTVHEPLAASSAVQEALARNVDAFSILTTQVMQSTAERAFLPTILWTIVLATGSIQSINDPASDAAIFNGQYVMLSRSLYERTGGHELVKGEIAEDLELARRLKKAGFRIALAGANDLVRTRMYRSFVELWDGFVKNFATGMRDRPLTSAAGLAGLALISPITPLAAAILCAGRHWVLGGVLLGALALTMAVADAGMRRVRFPAGSGFWLPAGIVVLLGICATSVARSVTPSGVSWRGRRYRGVLRHD